MPQEKCCNTWHVIFITIAAAIGGFLFGFDSSVINGANAALKIHFSATDFELAWAVSLTLIGAAAGAFFAGRIADRFGRTSCMFAAAILFIASAVGSGIPFCIYDFILWRLVGGIAMGIASIIAPIYIAETAPAHLRGRLGSMQQLAIVIGIFAALLSNYILVKMAGSATNLLIDNYKAWQVMFWVELIPASLYAIASLALPESPRYLIQKGRIADAKKVLEKIAPQNIEQEVKSIADSFHNSHRSRFSDLFEYTFESKRLLPIVSAGLGLAILQQFVGINVIFYYGTMLWQSVGFSESNSFFFSLFSSAINLVMTIVAIMLIDKVGRKPLLLTGSIGMSITLIVLGICFFIGLNACSFCGPIALIAANLYVAFFAATWGPVMWVMLGEMFNNRIRAIAISVCGLVQWLANFIVTWSFPILSGNHGIGIGATYLIYAIFAIFSFFFVLIFIEETKGKKLEDM